MKALKKNKALLITLLIFLGFVLFIFCAVQNKSRFHHTYSYNKSNQETIKVNMSAVPNEYFGAQVTSPGDYFVSTDSMLTAYNTQGGIAPPRIILMKGYQVTNSETYYKEVTDNPKHECIAVWATGGFSSIDDWSSSILQLPEGDVSENTTVKVGDREATVRKKTVDGKAIYEAYVQVSTADGGVSYYLNTCNAENKEDFLNVLKSLKIRADLSF